MRKYSWLKVILDLAIWVVFVGTLSVNGITWHDTAYYILAACVIALLAPERFEK